MAIAAALAAAVGLTVFVIVQSKSVIAPAASAPPVVAVAQPERRDLVRTITLPGDLRPYQEARVYAKVSGYLRWISVDRGDRVKAGAVIAALDAPEMEREYRRAKADMEMKQKVSSRVTDIRTNNRDLISLEEVEQAQTDFDMAKAKRDELDAMIAYTTIRVPFDGVVTARHVHPGALIQAGTTTQAQASAIVTVVDLSRLRVTVMVPESDVAWISRQTAVRMTLDARPNEIYAGTVTRYATALDPKSRTMPTEIEIGNPKELLYPGMYAHITLTLESLTNRITVPRQAMRADAGTPHVLIVEDSRVKVAPIRAGYQDATVVEVLDGLNGTEQVIVQGQNRVRPGDRVTAHPTDE
jgi:RND family efflux transporter MFP subunit